MKKTEQQREDRQVSLLAIDQYMREVRRRVRLTQEEEEECVRCLARGKSERTKASPHQQVLVAAGNARDRLAVQYQSLVIGVARHYVPNSFGMDLEDVVQEGNLGLLYALDAGEFRCVQQLRLFAKRCIRGTILKGFRDRGERVRLPHGVRDVYARMSQAFGELAAQLGREASLEEVAQTLGVSVERLVDVREMVRCADGVSSLQAIMQEEEADDRRDFVSLYQQACAEGQARTIELEKALEEAMETVLTQRQREVVRLRYGVGKEPCAGHKQREVAAQLGVVQSVVYNAEHRATKRLREALASFMESSPEELAG